MTFGKNDILLVLLRNIINYWLLFIIIIVQGLGQAGCIAESETHQKLTIGSHTHTEMNG